MITSPPVAYPEWKAPSEDGASLIWPAADELLRQTARNLDHLNQADHVLIQNTPLPVLRQAARIAIGHDPSIPLIATGHQTELHHPGVWAKNPMMVAIAQRCGGKAVHLAVDTDSPKHLNLRWPGQSLPISDDPAVHSAAWSGLLAAPTPAWREHLRSIARADAALAYEPVVFQFLDALSASPEAEQSCDALLTRLMAELDQTLGVEYSTLMASELWQSQAYLALAHHIASRAAAFAADYNAALADYRQRTGTRSAMRPMPDLFVSDEAVELPLWLDDLSTGLRTRPSVFAGGDRWILQLASGEQFEFDPRTPAATAAEALGKFLAQARYRFSPRALTLTMFMRLVLVDQFVHGIGGGRYDQVTDQIILKHFGLLPPAFSVTTATLYFPGAQHQQRVCLPCVLREGHRLRHGVLGAAKQRLVDQITGLPRRSAARQTLFATMQSDRRAALVIDPTYQQWEQKLAQTRIKLGEEKTIFDRELFYAMQTRARLSNIIANYQEAFDL
jgi:hypothetical protein